MNYLFRSFPEIIDEFKTLNSKERVRELDYVIKRCLEMQKLDIESIGRVTSQSLQLNDLYNKLVSANLELLKGSN